MNFSDIENFIAKSAPLLASAVGGPIAGVAVNLISNLFGSDPKNPDDILKKMQADPDAAMKLKQLEMQHEESLLQIQMQSYAKEIEDRSNARNFVLNFNQPSMMWFLTIMVFLVGASCLIGMTYFPEIKSELAMILTACIYEFKNIYKLFTGDSPQDNKEKS